MTGDVDPDRLDQEWQADQDVLRNLAENGDCSWIIRPVDVSFGGTIDALEALEQAAEKLGFAVIDHELSDDGKPWLFLQRSQKTDEKSIRELTHKCLQIERMFHVEYDGWGCVAETGLTH